MGMFMLILGAVTTGLSMAATYSAAKSQSKALAREGTLKAERRARQTKRLAATQKASFLQSGISLTGEGTPQTLLEETYDTGLADINLIRENYDRQSSNVMSKARSSMIGQMGTFALGAGLGSLGSTTKASAAGTKGGGLLPDMSFNESYMRGSIG